MTSLTMQRWAIALTIVGAAFVIGSNFLPVQIALVGWALGIIFFIAAISCALVDARRQHQNVAQRAYPVSSRER